MYKAVKLLFLLSLIICFSASAQIKIWGISPESGYTCSGSIWGVSADDSSSFTNYVNYTVAPDDLIPTSHVYSGSFIEDGDFYYGFTKVPGCDKQTQLIKLDKNGNKKQIKVFSEGNYYLFKGDANFVYVFDNSNGVILRITKTDGTTAKVIDFAPYSTINLVVKNNYLFIQNYDKLYRVKNDGSERTEIIDFISKKLPYPNFNYITSLTSDNTNIYISCGNDYFVIVPFASPKNYIIKNIVDYRVNNSAYPVFVNGNLYFLATRKTNIQKTLLIQVDSKFNTFNEINIPAGWDYRFLTHNSKQIVLGTGDDFIIFDTDKGIFIKGNIPYYSNEYAIGFFKNYRYYSAYFISESPSKINFVNSLSGIGFFNTVSMRDKIDYKFITPKIPIQVVDGTAKKLAFLERRADFQASYLNEIDTGTGKIIKSLEISRPFYNNILAINDEEYLYMDKSYFTAGYDNYIFSMDSVFRKIEMPKEYYVRADSIYKVKGRIFADAFSLYNEPEFSGVCEFKDNTFKKFIEFKVGDRVSLIDSDDEFIYVCQALDNFKTFKFYRINADGSSLVDLGVVADNFDNYYLQSPTCFKIGDYIYGFKDREAFFRLNIKTKKLEWQDIVIIDLQYSPITKELYALSYDWVPPNNTLNDLLLVNQENFTLTKIKQVNGTTSLYVEKGKIEHEIPDITATEEKNNSKESFPFPNPVVDFVNITKQNPNDRIIVYDATGREIQVNSINTRSNIYKLDFSKLPSGTYFIWTSGKSQSYKIIKQ